jgi:hypothetical protein
MHLQSASFCLRCLDVPIMGTFVTETETGLVSVAIPADVRGMTPRFSTAAHRHPSQLLSIRKLFLSSLKDAGGRQSQVL